MHDPPIARRRSTFAFTVVLPTMLAVWACDASPVRDEDTEAALDVIVFAGVANSQNVINIAIAASAPVGIVLPRGSMDDDVVTVTLYDRGGTEGALAQPTVGIAGGGVRVLRFDASTLADGPIDVVVQAETRHGTHASRFDAKFIKDTTPPVGPSVARVAGGQSNATGVINAATVSGVAVSVVFPVEASGDETFVITLTDGAHEVTSAMMPVAAGGGAYAVGGLDCSGLGDGPIDVMVRVTDRVQNVAQVAGNVALKDTTARTAPMTASVISGLGNAANVINRTNAGAVAVSIDWPPGASGAATAQLMLVSGAVVSATVIPPPRGGVTTVTGIDASALTDGMVLLSMMLADAAGNVTSFTGSTASKDTLAPVAATSVALAAGPGHPAGWVNASTASAISIAAAFSAGAQAGDMAVVTCSDGASSVTSSRQAIPPGGGVITFAGLDASALADGRFAITVTSVDAAGNLAVGAPGLAAKDTVAPPRASGAVVAAGASNAVNVINTSTVNGVSVAVAWPGDPGGGTMCVVLSDGVAAQASPPQGVTAAAGVITFATIDCTALAEGSLLVVVGVTDVAGNTTSANGSLVLKDTLAPAIPLSAHVLPSAGSAPDVINLQSVATVACGVTFAAPSGATDVVTVTLSGGLAAVSTPSAAVSGSVTFSGIDASTLADGRIALVVNVVDSAGNVSSWTGTPATKDTIAPVAPTAASVSAGGGNAANVINIASAGAVSVAIDWPAAATGSDAVQLMLTGGTSVVASVAQPAGGGTTLTPIDATALADGAVTIVITTTDAAGNTSVFTGISATKDTVAPVAPTAASVSAGGSNAANVINIANVGTVSVAIDWPVTASGADAVALTLAGGTSVVASVAQPAGGGTTTSLVDATTLADGAVSISVAITDVAGNTSVFTGTPATKDTVAPVVPTAASVSAGGGNAANVINIANVGTVSVAVDWPVTASGADAVALTLAGGTSVVASVAQPAGGGTTTSLVDATTLADGAVSISVAITDVAGNTSVFTGTPATKDTVAPVAPTAASVSAGGSNAANVINIANVGAVSVAIDWPVAASGADAVALTLAGGTSVVASVAQPAGGGTTMTTIDATALADGAVAIVVTTTDLAGNTTAFTGTAATKDTVAPVAPTAAAVSAGGSNGANVINLATAGSVSVAIDWPVAASGADSVQLMLTGGTSVVASVAQPAGGGTTMTTIDATALADGAVSISVTTTDAAGNTSVFTGISATKDTVAPVAPTAASVSAGGSNAANVINIANVGAVSVAIDWPVAASGADSVQLTLTGATSVTASVVQPAGGGTTLTPIDATALADGAVTIVITTTDAAGNTTAFTGTAATKDTVAPVAPTAASVSAGGSNAANVINIANVGAVSVAIDWPVAASGADSVQLMLTGATSVTASVVQPAGGGTTLTPIDATALADGAVTIVITTTDAAGNTTAFTGTAATKDTVAPVAPTAASVSAGGSNAANVINIANVGAVSVAIDWPVAASGADSVQLMLTGGTSVVASVAQPAGGGTTTSLVDATTLADGAVSISIAITDVAGNTSVFTGTPATKDTIAPVAPTAASVSAGGGNAANVINIASAGAVSVAVDWPAAATGSDAVQLMLTGGTSVTASVVQPAGGGMTVSVIDATALADGAVSISVTTTDAAGNTSVFTGTPATKDTVAPVAPTAASVIAGGSNAANVINIASAGAVSVAIDWPAAATGSDAVQLMLTGGTSVTAAVAQPAGGGMTMTTIDATPLSDGAVSVSIALTDTAGNTAVFTGVPAVKDTVSPSTLLVDPTTTPTSAGTQTVTGETEAGLSVTVTGGSAVASGAADSAGRFAIVTSLNIAATSALTVTANDAAGNTVATTVDFASNALVVDQSALAPFVTFSNATVASGLGDTANATGGAFQDFDNDGDLDFFVGSTNKLWRNDGTGAFTNVTGSAGTFSASTAAVFADYDNDGDLDMLLVRTNGVSLMRNDWIQTGVLTFTDQTAAAGAAVTGSLRGGFWGDLDQDGHIDFVVTDSDGGPVEVRRNLGGTFSAITPFGAAIATMRYGVVADFIADGRPDFILGDSTPSFFYRNDGALSFTNIAGASSNVSINHAAQTAGIIAVDYDNSGTLDIIASRGGAGATNVLFRNDGSSVFTAAVGPSPLALLAGIEPADTWRDLCAGDIDQDGRIDLFVGRTGAHRLFFNLGDLTANDGVFEFIEAASSCGIAGVAGTTRLVQMADIDGDGDLDLFAGRNGVADEVFRNQVANRRHLTVHVVGAGLGPGTSSPDAIGARVELRDATGATLLAIREINGGRGFGSQDPLRAHFGVTPSQIYTVRVSFPSGVVVQAASVVPRDAPNQAITVHE